MKIRWPRLITWFLFYFLVGLVFGWPQGLWVWAFIFLNDVITFVLDELGL